MHIKVETVAKPVNRINFAIKFITYSFQFKSLNPHTTRKV